MPDVRTTYVVIEAGEGAPLIRNCDFYITPLSCLQGILDVYLDDLDEGVSAALTLTVHCFTSAEYDVYCEEHDVCHED